MELLFVTFILRFLRNKNSHTLTATKTRNSWENQQQQQNKAENMLQELLALWSNSAESGAEPSQAKRRRVD
jgi:hypothetical protein